MRWTRFAFVVTVSLVAAACDDAVARISAAPVACVGSASAETNGGAATDRAAITGVPALDALPWQERIALEQVIAASDARFAPRMEAGVPVLETPAGMVATFAAGAAQLTVGPYRSSLAAVALGRGGSLRPLRANAPPVVVGAELRTALGSGVTECWRSLPSGLEHGVTIATRPPGDGQVEVAVALAGDLSAHLVSDDAVELRDAAGARVATYAHLAVLDAAGARLPAHMAMDGDRIVLSFDDTSARYPLWVDPLVIVEEATLDSSDPSTGFGSSIAVADGGVRAVVGAPQDDTAAGFEAGSARVFVRVAGGWRAEATLVASDAAPQDHFGSSVAMSNDGTRVIVGAPDDDTLGGLDAGSMYVFDLTGTSWTQAQNLVAPGVTPSWRMGSVVAIGSDRVIGGAVRATVGATVRAGSAYVFYRAPLTPTYGSVAVLSASTPRTDAGFGASVALSGDGVRAIVGAPDDDPGGLVNAGSAQVFLRVLGMPAMPNTWNPEPTGTLVAPDAVAGDTFGRSVAFGGGARVFIGAPLDDTPAVNGGSVRAFLLMAGTWTQQATLLSSGGTLLGSSLSANGAGDRVASSSSMGTTVFFRSGSSWSQEATLTLTGPLALTTDAALVLGGATGGMRAVNRSGTTWTPEPALLVSSFPVGGGAYGAAVAVSADGSRAIVGAPLDATNGTDAGAAHVFTRVGTTWALEARLLAAGGVGGDLFGHAVALSADASRALIGARGDTVGSTVGAGSARVFVRTGSVWTEEATLEAGAMAAAGDQLGFSVAFSSDASRAILGAPTDVVGPTQTGSARVFVRNVTSWSLEAVLAPSGGASGDEAGRAVAITADGSRALVGAPGDDVPTSNAGSGRMFVRSGTTWTEEATLLASARSANDRLGDAVAFAADGTRVILGAPMDDTGGGADAGSATVFVRSGTTWTEESTLAASGAATTDAFGASVALTSDGLRALVGAMGDDTAGGADAGSARLFVRAGAAWTEEATLTATGGALGDAFGVALALATDGSRAVVGAWTDDAAGGLDSGSARAFRLVGSAGTRCSAAPGCTSGFCTDGVCCNAACGDGDPIDCQACSAALTGGADGTCGALSAPVAATVTCRAAGGCDLAEVCTATGTACPADVLAPPSQVCRPAAGACDVEETCSGTDAACPRDAVATVSTTCRPAAITGCDVAEVCDGFDVNCPGDGFAGAGTVCRSAPLPCDVEEVCSGSSPVCPADAVRASTVVCRSLATACDVPEACTGAAPDCPVDAFAPATTGCGPGVVGPCDAPDHCEGTSGLCVPTFLSGVECRAALGACDVPEACAGSVATCPPDVLASAGVSCGGTGIGSCSSAGTCDGTLPACPGATPFPAGTVCLPAIAGAPCDIDDLCDGVSDACQPTFRAAGSVCDTAVTDVCDLPDICAGTTADCVPTFQIGTECRASSGPCDAPELCLGGTASCAPDVVASGGVLCRAATDPLCDPVEGCDGVRATCPADITMCGGDAGPGDAGASADGGARDAGSGIDSSAGIDAGATPTVTTGCACRLAPSRAPVSALLGSLLAIAVLYVGRVRRR